MIETNRRDVIALAAGAALAASAVDAFAQSTPPKAEYAIKKQPFDPSKIKGCRRSCSPATTRTTTRAR